MAEYWKSAPRYWCKQCKIFIRDTPFEKTQHEASPKHQGSLKRFLRDIHRNNEQQQRESQRAKSEVERLRQAVGGGPAKEDATGPAPWKKQAASVSDSAARPVSLEERKKQMAQLAEMGIAIPDEYRGEMALAGEWQTMSETKLDEQESGVKSIGVRKRKLEGDDEENGAEDGAQNESGRLVSKGWGSRMRSYPGAQNNEDEDLDALLASTKGPKKTKAADASAGFDAGQDNQPGEATLNTVDEKATVEPKAEDTDSPAQVKTEVPEKPTVSLAEEKPVEELAGPIFKKRKAKILRK
ncbi:hypothetical protein POX_a01409 [Penicillium oxalicum]|uniref:hypothetical protein n=1 Tax=Penicillium oxalicum TaxID=69781 RepID=UPI0020B6F426|nr:hypothetical protein POX_a01409 [Penicillium oxalicum]KAI2794808.1 hypothetical protein POX_a01409 [Penicillium oxalicum]